MKLYRPFIITIFIFLMISPYITAKDDDIDNLEYQVYKAVIEQGYLSHPSGFLDMKERKPILPKTIIIIDQTISARKIFRTPVDKLLKEERGDISFPENIVKSYMAINKAQYTLKNKLKIKAKHLLISEKQLEKDFLPNRWDSFYKHYPKALGYFRLSRVGFDTDKKTALVYVINSQYNLYGNGTFWLLKKEKGKWVCTGSRVVYVT